MFVCHVAVLAVRWTTAFALQDHRASHMKSALERVVPAFPLHLALRSTEREGTQGVAVGTAPLCHAGGGRVCAQT